MSDDDAHSRAGCREVSDRRAVIAGALAIGAGFANPAAAQTEPGARPLGAGDRFVFAKGPLKGELVRPEHLGLAQPGVEAFPFDPAAGVERRANRLNRVVLLRLDPAEMDAATRERSADGVLVYSAVCTHKGCTIQSWKEAERRLRCHCHLSEFDALAAGSVRGGPAQRQLPMAPVTLDTEGYVAATAGFTGKPGGSTT